MMLFTGDSIGIGAGRSLRGAAQLKVFAEDTQKLVDYLKANFTPYERYALKVYTGHSVENPIPGFYQPESPAVTSTTWTGASCRTRRPAPTPFSRGMWLVPDSGLRQMEVEQLQNGRQVTLLVRHRRGRDPAPGGLRSGRPEDAGVGSAP